MKPHALNQSDVARLAATPTPDARIETMTKLVQVLDGGALDPAERVLALEILHCFAADAEQAVREAVAWQIRNSPLLSPELAERLARDVDRVAIPILRHAAALADEVLLDIVAERSQAKNLAVAGRRRVSAAVADALVEHGAPTVVARLMDNLGADLGEPTLHRALDRFGRIRAVSEAMARRPGLPMAVVERLVAVVSDALRTALARRHGLAPKLVERLSTYAREAATVRLLRPLLRDDAEAEMTARWLHLNDRLTPSLLFRALCGGDVALFIACAAARAGVPVENARALAWDDGELGLRALFRKAGVPTVLEPPFRVAIAVVKDMGYDGGPEERDAFQAEIIARVFAACTPTDEWAVDDLLTQLFDQKSDEVIARAMDQAGLPFAPVC